ncbi:transcription elongation factor S-II [Coniochaeta ligniaria NRRL 30616]|uniref:Transcription elongation factor S-II n=1 Tax=Coniochaeta ligniaria NRRL 30616 TaxID=1408157 RepID=A0A1J7J1I3_9PEZI|nr:transcription elongation factor S-II [Coniochaeta ligniaria NRRL 30616]
MSNRRQQLLEAAQTFCTSFASQKPPEDIFSLFSTSPDVTAKEHGLPQLAPFLGREFKGQDGIREYFSLISSLLTYENMRFSNYIVDEVERKVSVRGEARFMWTSTWQSWDEVFTYMLAFDEDCKVLRYEIWADSGAAYLARRGRLIELL